jgi:hypothetical protein
MRSHAASGGQHEAAIDDGFIDRFGIVGLSDQVAERLRQLVGVGLDYIVIVGPPRDATPDLLAEWSHRFGQEVLPQVR